MVLANAASGCIVLGDMDENIWNEKGEGQVYKVHPMRACVVLFEHACVCAWAWVRACV